MERSTGASSSSSTLITNPDVSLVVGTIGRPDELRRMVASINTEITSGLTVELIVVDQSGSDATRDVLAEADLPFPYRHVHNRLGLSLARNTGLALATGRYVMFPDDDVWFSGSMLEQAVAHLDRTPSIGGVCARLVTGDGSDCMLRWSKHATYVTHRNHHRTSIGSVMVIRREVASSVGGFDETLGPGTGGWYGSCEDADFLLRIVERDSPIWYDPSLVVHHRDTQLDTGLEVERKALAYGCGQGRMWRLRSFSAAWISFLLIRRVLGSILIVLRGRPDVARTRQAWVRGALNGLMDQPPVELRPNVTNGAEPGDTSAGPTVGEFVKSFRWRIFMSAIGIMSTFMLTAVVARRLPDNELALFYVLLASLSIAPIVGRFGLNTKAVHELATARARGDWHGSISLARQAVRACLVPALLTGPVIAVVFVAWSSEAFVSYAILASLVLITDSVRLTYSDVFIGLGMPRWSALLSHYIRAVGVIIVLAFDQVFISDTLTLQRLLVLMTGVGIALVAVGHARLWVIPHQPSEIPRKLDVRALALAGAPFLLVDLVSVLILRGDVWLASKAFDESTAAIYSTASVLAKQIGTPIGVANIALAPIAAGYLLQRRTADLERIVRIVASVLNVLLLPVFIVIILAGDRLLAVAYGERFVEAHPYLVALMAGNIGIVTLGLSTTVLVMAGRQRLAMIMSVLWLALVAPIAIGAAYLLGPGALAVVSAAAIIGLQVLQATGAWVTTGIRVYPTVGTLWSLRLHWTQRNKPTAVGAEPDQQPSVASKGTGE